jgi:peptidoglycan/LPS O-acetylase OafA/YrhL
MAFDGFWHHSAHFWSLAVEEQFYVFWPFVVLFTARRHLPWAVGAIAILAPIVRITLLLTTDIWAAGAVIVTPSTFDALGIGALLALAWRSDLNVDWIVNWAAAVALPIFIFEQTVLSHDRVWSMLRISWPYLCVWCVHRASRGVMGPIGRLLSFRPLRRLGTVSYGMYLFHLFVTWAGWVLERRTGLRLAFYTPGPRQFAVVTALSALGATLSYKFIERPLNSLKERFPYVPTPPRVTGLSGKSTSESLVTDAI